jgi:hypothetical protein
MTSADDSRKATLQQTKTVIQPWRLRARFFEPHSDPRRLGRCLACGERGFPLLFSLGSTYSPHQANFDKKPLPESVQIH